MPVDTFIFVVSAVDPDPFDFRGIELVEKPSNPKQSVGGILSAQIDVPFHANSIPLTQWNANGDESSSQLMIGLGCSTKTSPAWPVVLGAHACAW